MFTFQAIQILIFLIPGFIASRTLNSLVVRKKDYKDTESVVEALIFSMLVYVICAFLGIKSPIALDTATSSITFSEPISFLWLILVSLVLPIMFALVINYDVHMKIVRWLHITKKTSRLSVWNDAFLDKKPRVIIDFVDRKRVFGWAEHFSDYPDKPYIYLAQPQWILEDGKYVDTGLDGMLITPEAKIGFVEFLKEESDNVSSTRKGGKNDTRKQTERSRDKAE